MKRMKMSDVGFKGQVFGFIKFTPFVESFLSGDLYMNNFKKYIDIESASGEKGVGDKFEAAHVFTELTMNFFTQDTNELIMSGRTKKLNFRKNINEKRPLYCMFAIIGDMLKVVNEDEKYYYTKFDLPNEQIDKMIREFGDSLIFVTPSQFIDRITRTLNEKGYAYRGGLVKYDDYNINSSARMSSYKNQGTDIYFWKDRYFENQYEYRIVLTDQEVDEAIIVNIGDISDISTIFNANEFFSDKFEIRLRKKGNLSIH